MKIDFLKINESMLQGSQKQINPPKNNVDKAAKTFATYLEDQVEWVRSAQVHSKDITNKFVMGEVNNIHDVIIAGEKSSLAMNTMNTIRKKLLEAYNEIKSTQI